MKYEMIFGDKKLFDGAPVDAEFAGWFCQEIRWYMIFSGKILFSDGDTWHTSDNPYLSADIAAMRRIIKEPNRWTWEDKKAGRLPEVGCVVVFVNDEDLIAPDNTIYPESGVEVEIVGKTKTSDGRWDVVVFKWLHEDGLSQRYASSGYCSDFNPIETPDEKAQREEDEFVESTCRQNEPHSTLYSDGVRAAYRKLKGDDNVS